MSIFNDKYKILLLDIIKTNTKGNAVIIYCKRKISEHIIKSFSFINFKVDGKFSSEQNTILKGDYLHSQIIIIVSNNTPLCENNFGIVSVNSVEARRRILNSIR
jgi:hypothetical protein